MVFISCRHLQKLSSYGDAEEDAISHVMFGTEIYGWARGLFSLMSPGGLWTFLLSTTPETQDRHTDRHTDRQTDRQTL